MYWRQWLPGFVFPRLGVEWVVGLTVGGYGCGWVGVCVWGGSVCVCACECALDPLCVCVSLSWLRNSELVCLSCLLMCLCDCLPVDVKEE